MVFGTGRRAAREQDYPQDESRVPYRLASYEHDMEGKRFKSSNVVFSFWSAVKYVFIISLMLWWLPMFGQMIAGYVGGRRAGGPWKGVAASIIPVVSLFVLMTSFDNGYLPSHVFGVAIAPGAVGAYLTTNIPFLSPYLEFSSQYVGQFVDSLAGSSPYGINTYVLTVAFAYVGGVLAEQNRREIEFTSGAVMHNTTVLVHDRQNQAQQEFEDGRQPSVFAQLGGVLHLGRHERDYPAANAGLFSRRRDPWAHAMEAHYASGYGDFNDNNLLPAYDDRDGYDDVTVARSGGRVRKLRSGGNQWHHHNQKRRGAPNLRSKPRFNYEQYEPQHSDRRFKDEGRGFMKHKEQSRFTVAPNPRSVRRAERMIDKEWGHPSRKAPRFEAEEEPAEETEAVAVPRRREHHSTHEWDSI
ncbi:MAG: hypothetical protein MUC90_03980 [Thermoplasmata archaeon]|nr:hypothetical protein [Thermoplasmata archaeon]